MTLSKPYWYAEIENPRPSSVQWRSPNLALIRRIAFCDIRFYPDEAPYITGSTLDNGTWFANQGASFDNLEFSMPQNYFDNPLQDITAPQITTVRYYSDRYGNGSSKDWISKLKALVPGFTLNGAIVKIWLCSGTVPGFNYLGGSGWDSVGGHGTVTWTPVSSYTPTDDSASLKFHGLCKEVKRSRDQISLVCESLVSRSDIEIGEENESGKNGSSGIIPIPIGNMDTDDLDLVAGFPVNTRTTRNADLVIYRSALPITSDPDDLRYIDESGYPAIIQSDIKKKDGNLFLSSSIPGATLERSRSATEKFKTSYSECTALGLRSVSEPHSQILFTDNGETIGLHSSAQGPGTDSAPELNPALPIVWPDDDRLESRGWNDTSGASHALGTGFNTADVEEGGARVSVILETPVGEIVEYTPGMTSSAVRSYGLSGNVWELKRNSEQDRTNSGSIIQISNRNYGPGFWPKTPPTITGLIPGPIENSYILIARPVKPGIDSGNDKMTGVSIHLAGYLNGGGAGSPSATLARLRLFADGIQMLTALKTGAENGTFDVFSYVYDPINFTDNVDKLFTEDYWKLQFDITSNNTNPPLTDDPYVVTFWHAYAHLNVVFFRFAFETQLAEKILLWTGSGANKYGASTAVFDVHEAMNTVCRSMCGISVSYGGGHNVITVAGAIAKKQKLRDVLRQMAMESRCVVKERDTDFLIADSGTEASPVVIAQTHIWLPESGDLELDYDYTPVSDLYSEIVVKFRPDWSNGNYSRTMSIGANRVKGWIRNYYGFSASDWAFFDEARVLNYQKRLQTANDYLGLTNGTGGQHRTKTYELDYVRNRESIERFLETALNWNSRQKLVVKLTGFLADLDSILVGDRIQISIDSSSGFYDPELAGKNYRVVTKRYVDGALGKGVYLEAIEIPKLVGEA